VWRNYLTVGFRALAKSRTYSIINIAGLAIGMAACLMILLYVRYELSYDKWLPNAQNTYQLQSHYRSKETGEEMHLQMTSYVAGTAFRKDFPQVDKIVYALSNEPVVLRDGQALATENVLLVDNLFFDVLQFPFAQGDPRTALSQVGSVVLTESEAKRLFGNENAMGKTLSMVSRGITTDFRVAGIVRDLPKNSHAKFSIVGRVDMTSFWTDSPDFLTSWGWQSGWVYFTLKPGTDPATIAQQLPAWEKRNIPNEQFGADTFNQGDEQDWKLPNIQQVHLGESDSGAMTPGNDRRTIVTFAIVAILILGMAVINFINLATARASQRAREVALRKVLGAARKQLITQFLGESVIVAVVAMLVALTLVELLVPPFAAFLDADLSVAYFGADGILLPVIALVLIVGVVGGLYPASFLSRFQPAEVLKANRSAAETPGSGRLRNILVVGQFAVSIGLIICTVVVYLQTVHARTVDPGYNRDGLIQVENLGRRQLMPLSDTIVAEMKRVKGVTAVGRSGIGVATSNNSNTGVQVPGRTEPVTIGVYSVDTGFFETMGIKLLAGRLFDENRPADNSETPFPEEPAAERALVARGMNVVINELAAQRMGYTSPQAAVGKQVKRAFDEDYGGVLPTTVIGVVRDSRFRSIRQPLDPIMFSYANNNTGNLLIRHDGSDPAGVRARTEAVWKRIAPEVPYDAKYSEDIIAELYDKEEARATIFAAFAILAVIIACLGLFGLAAFTAERRTKEIGIRKVLGARTRDIVRLLVWQFSRPVVIANLIAWPVAWWVMRDWLNGFDARIALTPVPFLIAGVLALLIAIVTVGGHAVRIARSSPIHALRYE